MIDLSVSLLPFFVIAIANFFLSWIYYSPAMPWFKTWQKGVGLDPTKTEMSKEEKQRMPLLMGGAAVSTLLFSFGLQVIVHSLGAIDFLTGASVGLVIWCGFAVSHSLNTQFEGRKPIVLVINQGLYLVSYAFFGGIVAIWN
jgi:hypothetical protein